MMDKLHLVNPRPDLDGADLWARLLLKAYALDGKAAGGLFGALHGLRCLGAGLRKGKLTVMLEPGEIPPAAYRELRDRYLVPHAAQLTTLLGELAE